MKRRTFLGALAAGVAALASAGRPKPEPGRLRDDLRVTAPPAPPRLKPIVYGQARGGFIAGEDLRGGAVCYVGCDGRVFNMAAAEVGARRMAGIAGRQFKRDEAVTLYMSGEAM